MNEKILIDLREYLRLKEIEENGDCIKIIKHIKLNDGYENTSILYNGNLQAIQKVSDEYNELFGMYVKLKERNIFRRIFNL